MANEIIHFHGYTIRVVGSGELRGTLYGFDKVESEVLPTLTMSNPNRLEPTRLANFTAQRALLRLETTGINEWFKINNLTLWMKELWTQYPE